MKKYYRRNNFGEIDMDGLCYPLRHFKEDRHLFENDTILVEAKIEYNTGYFYCSEFSEVGETGAYESSCGRECKQYKPRNGKNGRCRFSKNCYEPTDKKFRLTKELKLIPETSK